MRRLLFWMTLAIVLVITSVAFDNGSVQAQATGTLGTTTTEIWQRSGPGTDWRRLTTVPEGTTVAIDGRDMSAAWVRGSTPEGDVGWMYVYYIFLGDVDVLTLPYVAVESEFGLAAPTQGAGPQSGGDGGGAPTQGTPTTLSANVNIRSGPSTNYRVVGAGTSGSTMNLDGRDGLLEWVRGITGGGTVGWVSVDYISLNYDQIAALSIVTVNTPFGLSPASGAADTGSEVAAPSSVDIVPVVSTAPVSGFSYGGHVAGLSERTAATMHSIGMTWVKYQLRHGSGAHPSSAAGMINEAHGNGFRVLISIVGGGSDILRPGYFEEYANFAAGVAALGADAIEVWNEMNLAREWPAGHVNPELYTQLLAPTYNAIKGANPNTLVISGALAPTGFFGGCGHDGCDDAPYIAGMAAAGAANYMDCLGIHYNEGIVPPSQTSGDPRSEHYTRYFWGMVNTYWNAFGGARPLCFTELGYLSPDGYGPLSTHFAWGASTSAGEQGTWVAQAIDLARGSGRVRLVIIWNINMSTYGDDPQAGYAILRPDGTCPACYALGGG